MSVTREVSNFLRFGKLYLVLFRRDHNMKKPDQPVPELGV